MMFGPRTCTSPTVPRGTSLSSASAIRTSTSNAGRPQLCARGPSGSGWCTSIAVTSGAASVIPYTCRKRTPGIVCFAFCSTASGIGEAP